MIDSHTESLMEELSSIMKKKIKYFKTEAEEIERINARDHLATSAAM